MTLKYFTPSQMRDRFPLSDKSDTCPTIRSGWCRLLNSYLPRLDPTDHWTRSTPKANTELTVINLCLWTKPMAITVFLDLEIAETLEDDRL